MILEDLELVVLELSKPRASGDDPTSCQGRLVAGV